MDKLTKAQEEAIGDIAVDLALRFPNENPGTLMILILEASANRIGIELDRDAIQEMEDYINDQA